MSTKYIFVTGGVVSGLGKGITAASLGRLLKARGMRVTMQKLDPYFNIDPGTMNPIQHGEVFVTDDGAETDLDLGHYERFIDENLNSSSNATSGKIYQNVLSRERRGDYNGGTVQIIPHITREIQEYIAMNKQNADIAIVEIGGTVGDIESQAFLEAIRQFSNTIGRNNCLFIHVTLLVYLAASKEHKTKPTQHSVKELLRVGIQPDIIVLRSEQPFDPSIKGKIATFCNIKEKNVIANLDVPLLYEAPLFLKGEKLDDIVCEYFGIDVNAPQDLSDWIEMVETAKNLTESVRIAMVGKYTALHDSYISVVEALKHGGFGNKVDIDIKWVDSDTITETNVFEKLGDYEYAKDLATVYKAETEFSKGNYTTATSYYQAVSDKAETPGFPIQAKKANFATRVTLEKMTGSYNPSYNHITMDKYKKKKLIGWWSNVGTWGQQYLTISYSENEDGTFDVTGEVQFMRYTKYAKKESGIKKGPCKLPIELKNISQFPTKIQLAKGVSLTYQHNVFQLSYSKTDNNKKKKTKVVYKSQVTYKKS